MKIEKVKYSTQYPYCIRDEWDGVIWLTKEDLKILQKALDKFIKKEYNEGIKTKEEQIDG